METSVPLLLSKKEKYYLHNTLLCLVKALENRYTVIDLRNETSVTGKIVEVDGYMNVLLSDVAMFDTDGEYQYFSVLHIQARNIRNVHIPRNISIMKAIKSQVIKPPVKPSQKKTFKQSRALKQQKETLKLIADLKKSDGAKKKEKQSD